MAEVDGQTAKEVSAPPPTEGTESRVIVEHALAVCRELSIGTLLVQADDGRDVRLFDTRRGEERIIWLVAQKAVEDFDAPERDVVLAMPDISGTRMSPVSIGLFLATIHEHIGRGETVMCLSGGVGGKRLDTMIVTNPQRDFPWLAQRRLSEAFPKVITKEFARVLNIALRFANEGREGKRIGTVFVLGDPDELEPYLKQLILNPCAGHPVRKRNIFDKEFLETLRELSALDGAFIIDGKGITRSAGTYIDAPSRSTKLPSGLGARHMAGAAITLATSAISVVLSESSGTITVYHQGVTILTLERP